MLTISIETARRFILGRQGLWPGRRWKGKSGADKAMRAVEHLQLDPLVVIARSHDLMLHSRVVDYEQDQWSELTYRDRKFFDWGGWLAVRPMDELPHWRVMMRRERDHPHWVRFAREHATAIDEMRQILRKRKTVSNRDFNMKDRTRTNSYRGRKDSSVALYYLWRVGEAMVYRRERFERVYALTEHVAPAHLICESSDAEADHFMIVKSIAWSGITPFKRLTSELQRRISPSELKQHREKMLSDGEIVEIKIDGWKDPHYVLFSDLKSLEDLQRGKTPKAWKPLDTTNDDEALFLSPLDPAIHNRARLKALFNFDYTWEVYVPAPKRKWGYYTLPILWGDSLVARIDTKLERNTNTLIVNGLWLEDKKFGKDEHFAEAFAGGMSRFAGFHDAVKIDARKIEPPLLRKRISQTTR